MDGTVAFARKTLPYEERIGRENRKSNYDLE
jgi:hypothetical protein